jgi:chitin synthase
MIIWFICACTVFVIAVLSVVICSTEHVYDTAELASYSSTLSPNNVLISIQGEVFDLTSVAERPETHRRVAGVVPVKSILKYGGQSSDGKSVIGMYTLSTFHD